MPYDGYGNYNPNGPYHVRPTNFDKQVRHPNHDSKAKAIFSFGLFWAFFIFGAIFMVPSLISMFF